MSEELSIDAAGGPPQGDAGAPGYRVRLEKFEGPLDLLLHLIKRDEVDIYDIPIAHITQQYLEYLDVLREFNLEVAGEFLVMAATLMRIKVRMLLPAPPSEEEEEQDPREALVRQLLEYRKFKEVAERLKEREEVRRRVFERGMPGQFDGAEPLPLRPVSLFDLLDVFRQVSLRVHNLPAYEVQAEAVYIEDMMARIRDELGARERITFRELLLRCTRRVEMIVTFMALLEMMKLGEVDVEQPETLGEIYIVRPVYREPVQYDDDRWPGSGGEPAPGMNQEAGAGAGAGAGTQDRREPTEADRDDIGSDQGRDHDR